ncbi:VWA domain-containing protein [Sulfurimonas sp.]|uniref:VWA domain-containing protein n=1 Tax=Sulfurimonas sp. TaxID=2022749 RepID=UPI003562C0BB
MFDGIYFEFPKLVFVIFFFIACASLCKMRLPSIYFPHTASFMKNTASKSKLLFFLKWLSIVMFVMALMSPVKDEPYELEPKDGYEMALVLDASGSMKARGFDMTSPLSTRFDVVKEIVSDFIEKRKNDNIGLIVFGAYSFIASPLTYDENILKGIVKELHIGMAGEKTALYESLAQGVNLLKMSESKSKVIILLTDGYNAPENNFPLDVALDMVKKEKIKVYPIGIGGPNEYNRNVLVQIAQESGGQAFGAANAGELEEVYKRIDELEKSEIKNETFSYLQYYYIYPLFIGFLSLMFYVYMRNKIGASE